MSCVNVFYIKFVGITGTVHVAESMGKVIGTSLSDPEGKSMFKDIAKRLPGSEFTDKTDNPTPLLLEAKKQILEYFRRERRFFDLPLEMLGTDFQVRIWKEMSRIPYGETWSYGQLAEAAGSPKGARAAGGACHQNLIPLVIPCHRVIGANGSLTGFGGGLALKLQLLKLEGNEDYIEAKRS